eukprot:8741673-Karenia_brevis.AAC.1
MAIVFFVKKPFMVLVVDDVQKPRIIATNVGVRIIGIHLNEEGRNNNEAHQGIYHEWNLDLRGRLARLPATAHSKVMPLLEA